MKNVTKYLSLLLGILLLPLLTSCSAAGSSAAPTPDLQTTAAVSSEASPEAVPGYFQDAALEEAVRAAIQKPSGELTREDFESVKEFSYTGSATAPLTSLSGIEQLVNLETLTIQNAGLTDIGALGGLKNLKSLALRSNRIQSLSPLSGLARLETLDLIHNLVTDVGPLSGLQNLTELYLDFNQISDLSPLSGLTKLTKLGFTDNKVSDIQFVSALTDMQCLYMSGNYSIQDYSPITELKSIRRISVDFFDQESIALLESFPALYSVTFFGTEVIPAQNELTPNLTAYYELLDEADKVLASVVKADTTDYEKEYAIYSYIVDNVAYGNIEGDQDGSTYSARGALICKKCVCMGFSHALCLLMNKAGIQCISINDNADHAWNIVKLDDGYYHVDASRASMKHAKDRYFNMTDEVASQDREWNTACYPACTGTEYAGVPSGN